jgi:hypothetical protein
MSKERSPRNAPENSAKAPGEEPTLGALAAAAIELVDQLLKLQFAAQQQRIYSGQGKGRPRVIQTENGLRHELPLPSLLDHVGWIAQRVVRLQPLLDHFGSDLRRRVYQAGLKDRDPGMVQALHLATLILGSAGIVQELKLDDTKLCDALWSDLQQDLGTLMSRVQNEGATLIEGAKDFERRVASRPHKKTSCTDAILRTYAKAGKEGFRSHDDVALAANMKGERVRRLSPGLVKLGLLREFKTPRLRCITEAGLKWIEAADNPLP